MYGLELILFTHAMLSVGSAIVGDWLQFFLATLTLFLYLDREGLLLEQGLLECQTMFVYRNPEGFVRSTFLLPIESLEYQDGDRLIFVDEWLRLVETNFLRLHSSLGHNKAMPDY
jgi:hypothetical protein